jgi:signal transduction histidine kinase
MNNSQINVLLIEDNPGDTRLIWETLAENSEARINLEYIDRLETGLARIGKGGIDVVLLDLMLPDSWGIDTFIKVHDKAPGIPIVVLTSLNDEVIAVQAMQKGAQDYLVKGQVDVNLLERTIRYAIVRKRAEVALQESNRHLEETLSELKTTQKQVVNQERLRVLGEMASGIAHNFNNALSPILSFSEILLMHPDKLDDKSKVKRYLLMMNTAAKDAANVVSRLSKFYRSNDAVENFQPVDLNDLVQQVIALTMPMWKDEAQAGGKMIQVVTELNEIPPIAGYEVDLREALINLTFNAVDAIQEKGTITFRTRSDSEQVILEVSDNGQGMTEETRKHCMDPFYTTKDKKGTGFGLAIIHSIVERHYGTLKNGSEWGKGTTFVIYLPIKQKQKSENTDQDEITSSHTLPPL